MPAAAGVYVPACGSFRKGAALDAVILRARRIGPKDLSRFQKTEERFFAFRDPMRFEHKKPSYYWRPPTPHRD
jgi:hypothetical protein